MSLRERFRSIARLFEPQPMEVYTKIHPGGCREQWLTKKPLVTEVSHRMADEAEFWLREGGYRFLEREIIAPVTLYARPLPVWTVLKARILLRDFFWKVLNLTYRRLWYIPARFDGYRFSPLHMRPGPGPFFRWRRDCKEAWIRIPHWVYCLRYLLPINYKNDHAPPHGVYLSWESKESDGQWKRKKFHPVRIGPLKRLHIDFGGWFWEN